MARARGSTAKLRMKFESSYGEKPSGNWLGLPFASINHGASQDLIPDELLGNGREPLQPSRDVINVGGDLVVPVALRDFGHWLKALLGGPTTSQIAATGTITFSGQPAAGSTLSLNGVTWTLVSGVAGANETTTGASLADTLTALASDLNGSADTGIDDATYSANATTLTVTHDTLGAAGNAYTLAASAASNGAASGATLTGGGYQHLFESGATEVPSFALELALPDADTPAFFVTVGNKVNSLALNFQRSGQAQAQLGLIGQGETRYGATQAGTPTTQTLSRFSQFEGSIKKAGTAIANVTAATLSFTNSAEGVPTIRDDGKIEGVDEGVAACSGTIEARFADAAALLEPSETGDSISLSMGYTKTAHEKVLFEMPETYLPRRRQAVSGPGGVQASYEWQAAYNSGAGYMLRVTLRNDVASYA